MVNDLLTFGLRRRVRAALGALTAMLALAACSTPPEAPPSAPKPTMGEAEYKIGPGDQLNIFVWRNPELSTTVPVRPDGKISIPLINDLPVSGRTPTQVGQDVEQQLKKYVQDAIVTVIVTSFQGPFSEQVRVVGEAALPQAIAYRENMTALDVMIAVRGLTQFAAGNDATIVRQGANGQQEALRVRLDDLLIDGDVGANVPMMPGDILVIPRSWF
jgi:polysaccharide export outer membrane protein